MKNKQAKHKKIVTDKLHKCIKTLSCEHLKIKINSGGKIIKSLEEFETEISFSKLIILVVKFIFDLLHTTSYVFNAATNKK